MQKRYGSQAPAWRKEDAAVERVAATQAETPAERQGWVSGSSAERGPPAISRDAVQRKEAHQSTDGLAAAPTTAEQVSSAAFGHTADGHDLVPGALPEGFDERMCILLEQRAAARDVHAKEASERQLVTEVDGITSSQRAELFLRLVGDLNRPTRLAELYRKLDSDARQEIVFVLRNGGDRTSTSPSGKAVGEANSAGAASQAPVDAAAVGEQAAPLQRKEAALPAADEPADRGTPVVTRAAEGVSGPGISMPHRESIEAAFGHHGVRGIQAHVGGAAADAAAAIGAEAYATGDQVAFAGPPDLHTAAHEAAHVVQQRGGVQLKDGVGRAGDFYEQHADAVADRVVKGESAEDLLDQVTGDSPTHAVQLQGPARRQATAEPARQGCSAPRGDGHLGHDSS